MRYLISYDIAEDRRRYRVVKRLKQCARRLQYSVFEGDLTDAASRRLWRDLLTLIDPEKDGLLLVSLCQGCQARRLQAGSTGFVEIEEDVVV